MRVTPLSSASVGESDACETVHERSHRRQGPFRSCLRLWYSFEGPSPEETAVKHVISTLANVGGRGKVLLAPFSVRALSASSQGCDRRRILADLRGCSAPPRRGVSDHHVQGVRDGSEHQR